MPAEKLIRAEVIVLNGAPEIAWAVGAFVEVNGVVVDMDVDVPWKSKMTAWEAAAMAARARTDAKRVDLMVLNMVRTLGRATSPNPAL